MSDESERNGDWRGFWCPCFDCWCVGGLGREREGSYLKGVEKGYNGNLTSSLCNVEKFFLLC